MINKIGSNQLQSIQRAELSAIPSEEFHPDISIPPTRALMNLVSSQARKVSQQIEKSAGLLETIRNSSFHSIFGF